MICPKCKDGKMEKQVSLKGLIINLRKEVIYFCPLCDFENKKIFKLSREDMKIEKIQKLDKPKEIIQKHYSMKGNLK